jgi:hypothetical protein
MKEQFQAAAEEKKIIENKNLTFLDKYDAVKSVRSLSRTIEGLIGREKEKISEICKESQGQYNTRNNYPQGLNSMKSSDLLIMGKVSNG